SSGEMTLEEAIRLAGEEEREEAAKLAAETDAREHWLKGMAAAVAGVETFVGQYTDEFFPCYLREGSPGWFPHGVTPERLDAAASALSRLRTILMANNGGGDGSASQS